MRKISTRPEVNDPINIAEDLFLWMFLVIALHIERSLRLGDPSFKKLKKHFLVQSLWPC